MPIAVNMSSRQFRGPIADSILRTLRETELDPGLLELELTEGLMMHSTDSALQELRRLKGQGVKLAIDDFGIGYSSLAYLKRFPIDKLKIDQSFVRDLIIDPEDRAIANAIISMAHSLRLRVVAEGVESEEQLAILRAQGCDEAQGYLFSHPLPADEFTSFLMRERPSVSNLR
jgi:EAL domain-containing protein (putative c-di-GMP-specific phosphodiesterase class I)